MSDPSSSIHPNYPPSPHSIRRMLSNRESARRSRRRKQAHLGDLQVKVDSLTEENQRLLQKLHALHASFNGVMQRNRVVKQNMAYLRAQLISGKSATREVLEAATVAMNAGAHAEHMLRLVAAGNAVPGSVVPGGASEMNQASTLGMNAMGAANGQYTMHNPLPVGHMEPYFGAAHAENTQLTNPQQQQQRRVSNFPLMCGGSGVGPGRGSESSSLTYVTERAGPSIRDGNPGRSDSMQSVDAKTYAGAVKTKGGGRQKQSGDTNTVLAAAIAEQLAIPSNQNNLSASPLGGANGLDHHEQALAAQIAANLGSISNLDMTTRGMLGAFGAMGGLTNGDFNLPGGAVAAASAAAAAQRGRTTHQRSDGSADAGGSGTGMDGDALGDVGAQSADETRELSHAFLGTSPNGVILSEEEHGEDQRLIEHDHHDGFYLDTHVDDWFVEHTEVKEVKDEGHKNSSQKKTSQKIGRSDSMNRVASAERLAKKAAVGSNPGGTP